jgi:hypothetical protein
LLLRRRYTDDGRGASGAEPLTACLEIVGSNEWKSRRDLASKHPLKRFRWNQQAPSDTDCRNFPSFCRLVRGSPRDDAEDDGGFRERHYFAVAGNLHFLHRTLRFKKGLDMDSVVEYERMTKKPRLMDV